MSRPAEANLVAFSTYSYEPESLSRRILETVKWELEEYSKDFAQAFVIPSWIRRSKARSAKELRPGTRVTLHNPVTATGEDPLRSIDANPADNIGAHAYRRISKSLPATPTPSEIDESLFSRFRIRQGFGPYEDNRSSAISLPELIDFCQNRPFACIPDLLRDLMNISQAIIPEGNSRRPCLRIMIEQDPEIWFEILPASFPESFSPFAAAEPEGADELAGSCQICDVTVQPEHREVPGSVDEQARFMEENIGGALACRLKVKRWSV